MGRTAMLLVKSCVNTSTLRIHIVTAKLPAKLKVTDGFFVSNVLCINS